MTSTDRAFIAALQQASATTAPPAKAPAPAFGSPHFVAPVANAPVATPAAETKRRAPLSEHLARRRQAAQEPFRPGVETPAFAWPAVVEALADQARDPLQEVIDVVTRGGVDTPAPSVLLLGAQPAVGTTTTLLAIARLVSKMGGRVAILDQGGGAAAQLGVRRSASGEALAGPAIDDAVVASSADSVSVLVTAPSIDPALALERLTVEHDLVLVDRATPVAGFDHTLLLDAAGADTAPREAVLQTLADNDIALSGLIETLG